MKFQERRGPEALHTSCPTIGEAGSAAGVHVADHGGSWRMMADRGGGKILAIRSKIKSKKKMEKGGHPHTPWKKA